MFATIALPSTPTPLSTLFGFSENTIKRFRYSFPSTNANSATIAKPANLAAGVTDTTAERGTSSMEQTDVLANTIVSGTATDFIVLEYCDPGLNIC
jgi:hypothetical protein